MTDWLKSGNNAVITGGASGIGLAAAEHYLAAGMNVLIADLNEEALDIAADALAKGSQNGTVLKQLCDVSDFAQVEALQAAAIDRLGHVHCLMNNAGVGLPPNAPWENLETWKKQIEINLWGIIHGPRVDHRRALSRGFTYTGMIARFVPEKPAGAWTPEQAVEFMIASLERGDFYILCPDNDTPRTLDEKRIQWNTDDLLRNRPALSRWDPAYESEYASYIED